ncbi:hypothetical protein DY000_02047504 [Brassica cretica]|uniref:Arabidopsis retrotransposon Orf1 C-terminal domain-containing protein n=1 Tax=Brassica cretica TaxID=69181 RepID=A0ABQ7EZ38_BRACR|nr:hypothetical protein DY000_02047504 [Brassica cretica]
MGLERLLTLQKPVYATATYQFLSSLEATHRSREDPEDGYGFITFKIGRQDYRMSFKQISEVMGFPDRRDPRIEGTKDDPELLWYMIGAGVYNTKLIKGADIRNPSIRYVQRILASTFYARKDPGRIVEDELHFLTWCLKDVIGEMFDDGNEVRFGIRTQPGIVGILVKRLLHYQDWAWTKKDKEPRLSIEGLITPLLEAMVVPLPEADKGYALMDEPFLTNIGFLDGQVGNSWVYRFKVVKQEGKYVRTFLPNQSLTSISKRNNIKFRLPQEALYNSEIPKKISRSKKKQAIDDSQPEEQAEQGSSSSIYGSSRYYFPPYSGALPDGPLREAHQQIRTLQRGNKFQDRTIAKLVKSVNYLAKKLKNLTMRPRRSRASTLVTTDDPMEDDGTGVEEEPVHTHRHSYHGDASATEVYYEEPRASLREPRQPGDELDGGVWDELGSGEPKTSSTTVSGKSHGDSVVISNVEGKKRETRGLGCHSKWWLTAAELRSLKAAWCHFAVTYRAHTLPATNKPSSQPIVAILKCPRHHVDKTTRSTASSLRDLGAPAANTRRNHSVSFAACVREIESPQVNPLRRVPLLRWYDARGPVEKVGVLSSSRAKGHKDKEIMREDPIEEEESHEADSEDGSEDEPAPKKRERAPKPPKKKKPPPSEIVRLFKAMEFLPTTYPDPLMLQCLGIYDDVSILLRRMGLERLLTLLKPAYETATYQFLSSVEATYCLREDPEDGNGFIKFKIERQTYRMSFKRISEVMGFPDKRDPRIEGAKDDPEFLILASTLYARKDPGRIVEDELNFLTLSLKDVIGTTFDGGPEVRIGTQPGIVGIFVKRLVHYQEWAWTKKDKEPKLSIGGLITPLL